MLGTIITWLVALVMGFGIWWVCRWFIGILSAVPPEIDPEAVVEVDIDFRCTVCGAEATLRAVNVEEANPPKHCREEMVPMSGS